MTLFTHRVYFRLLLAGWGLLARPATAQTLAATAPNRPFAVASEAVNPSLDFALRQLMGQAQVFSPAELRRINSQMSIGQGAAGATVLVRVLARDVAGLLPTLRTRGFAVEYSAPQLRAGCPRGSWRA